jgi:CheY-like chemotaxis protein
MIEKNLNINASKSNRGTTILVVEDNSYIRNLACSILTKQDYNVLTANNGVEAINMLNVYGAKVIDMIITDYKMPQMNGLELMKRVRQIKEFANTPVILLSQHNSIFFSEQNKSQLEIFDALVHKAGLHKLLSKEVCDLLSMRPFEVRESYSA